MAEHSDDVSALTSLLCFIGGMLLLFLLGVILFVRHRNNMAHNFA